MSTETIERWIKNLERTYDILVAEGVIPNRPLSAGSRRSSMDILRESGVMISRFQMLCLTYELKLVIRQPGSHVYKQATAECPDIPN